MATAIIASVRSGLMAVTKYTSGRTNRNTDAYVGQKSSVPSTGTPSHRAVAVGANSSGIAPERSTNAPRMSDHRRGRTGRRVGVLAGVVTSSSQQKGAVAADYGAAVVLVRA